MRLRPILAAFVAVVLGVCLVHGAGLQLGGRTADEWVKTLETPQRIASL